MGISTRYLQEGEWLGGVTNTAIYALFENIFYKIFFETTLLAIWMPNLFSHFSCFLNSYYIVLHCSIVYHNISSEAQLVLGT